MSYRQQLRRDLQRHRREKGLALLNAKVAELLPGALAESTRVTDEASTPVNPPSSGVS